MRESICVVLSYPVCGNLLQQHWERNSGVRQTSPNDLTGTLTGPVPPSLLHQGRDTRISEGKISDLRREFQSSGCEVLGLKIKEGSALPLIYE